MKVLIFADIHNDLKALERVMAIEADYYIAAGDLVTMGRGLDRCGEVMRPRAARTWVMPGNNESAAQIESFCADFGFRNFHCASFELDGRHFAGLGYSNLTPFHTPGEYTEAELAERLEPFSTLQPLVLVSHCPPLGTAVDRAGEGKHFGSSAVRDFVVKHQPRYCFCGHIHEAEGAEARIGETLAVNVGKRGYLLEW
jgi:Icc-related predicted phosphoesterase